MKIKFIIQLAIFAAFSFMVGFSIKYHYPQFKIWALYQIREQSSKELGIEVKPHNLEITLLPIGISLHQIEISPQKEKKREFPNISAKSISASLDMLGLFSGKLRLSNLKIIEPTVHYIQKSTTAKKAQFKPEFSFRFLQTIPLNQLKIVNLNLNLRLNEPSLSIATEKFSITLSNNDKALDFDISTPSLKYKNISDEFQIDVGATTKGRIQRNEVQFSKFQIQYGNSYIIARGAAHGKTEELLLHDMEFDTKVHLDVKQSRDLTQQILKKTKLPNAEGEIDLVSIISYSGSAGYNAQFLTKSKDLRVEKYIIGNIESRGKYTQNAIQLDHFFISNNSGRFGLKTAKITVGEKINLDTNLQVDKLELQKFLANLDLGEIPTVLEIAGNFDCSGEAYPNLLLNCNGSAKGKDLHVYAKTLKDKFSIVKLPDFGAKGSVKVSLSEVSYIADLSVNEYKGSSRGTIDYKRGFKIFYDTPTISFSSLSHFVGLKFEGLAKISGSTEGNSSTATMSAKAQVNDFWLEDYLLDTSEFNVNYAKDILTISDLSGRIDSTTYSGNVDINLHDEQIKVSAKSNDTDLKDVQRSLSRHINLPVEISGFGRFQAQVSGPLDIHKLDFKLLSHFNDGKIATESFDSGIVSFSADKGNIRANKIIITKNASQVSLTGTISNQGVAQLLVTGDQLRLEESQLLKSRLQDLRGQLDFDLSITGPLPKVTTQFRGYLSQMSLGAEPIESSTFALNFSEKSISGNGKFFGTRVTSQFEIPFTPHDNFKLYLNAKDWNFLPLAGLLVKSERQWDYKSSLTGILDIKSLNNGFWNSSGSAHIEKISIERGPVALTSEAPVKVVFDDGKITSSNLNLKGTNSYFRFNSTNSTKQSLNMTTTAKIDMTLLALLAPTLKELRGQMSLSLKILGTSSEPSILGSGFIEDGLVKLPEFPATFQNIRADILFNNKKVLVNSVTASLGGGDIQANGAVTFTKDKFPTVDVRGLFDSVHLNIPDGIKSVGSGAVIFSGTGLPYTINVRANIDNSEITREFSNDDATTSGAIKQSALMPKVASNKDVSPILLQLNLNIADSTKIKNSLLNTNIAGQLQVLGEPKEPKLVGQINLIKGGKLFFRETPFEISSGQIRFKEVMANPELYISSAARVYDHDVTLLVQGTGLKPALQLSSQPNLTQDEIICLLALGLTCNDLEKRVASQQQGQQSSYQIGAALISQNPLKKQVKDRYGVDLGISSAFDSDNSAVPQISIGKQITPTIGAKVIRSVGKDRVDAQVFWNLNRNWSFVGSWEGREETNSGTSTTTEKQIKNNNAVGVDLEYKVEFK